MLPVIPMSFSSLTNRGRTGSPSPRKFSPVCTPSGWNKLLLTMRARPATGRLMVSVRTRGGTKSRGVRYVGRVSRLSQISAAIDCVVTRPCRAVVERLRCISHSAARRNDTGKENVQCKEAPSR